MVCPINVLPRQTKTFRDTDSRAGNQENGNLRRERKKLQKSEDLMGREQLDVVSIFLTGRDGDFSQRISDGVNLVVINEVDIIPAILEQVSYT